MKTYKEFVDRMIEKGYILSYDRPIIIDESNDMVKTFPVKKGTIGKILELLCPDNSVIALCGTEHNGGCHNSYIFNIRCTNNEGRQPFQEIHYSTELKSTMHVVAEIIVTKILRQDPPLDNKKVKEWSETIGPILKLIGSNNLLEHVMWVGAYPKFNSEFNKTSFTLYGDQKMTLYIIKPDIDITNVKFDMKVDIFKYNGDTHS